MPTDALGLTQTLAGLSAGSATLQNLLTTVTTRSTDRNAMIAAIELDPVLLLAILPRRPGRRLKDWHDGLPTAFIAGMALDAAIRIAIDPNDNVMASIRRGLIAGELATRISGPDAQECRLTAMLAEAVEARTSEPDEFAALPALTAEAIRFQHEPLGKLEGAPALVRVVAASRPLARAIDHPIETSVASQCRDLLGLDENRIEEVRSVAGWQFEQLSRRLTPAATPDRVNAARAAILYRALAKSVEEQDAETLVASAAEHLLGAHATLLFQTTNDGLVSHLDGEAIRIAADAADSLLASCYRSGRIASSGGGDVHIVERQLLGRFEDCALTAIPLGDVGVLAYLAPPDDTIADILLQGFADATTDLITKASPGETVAIDELQHTVREIIHEVNNPLAIVQNYLRTLSLKLGDDNPVEREVDTISRELMRASSLLQKFRHLGRAEPLLLAETDVNALVRDLGIALHDANEGVAFDYRLDTDIPVLMLPKEALSQVMLNLMKNAVEALADTAEPRITVSTQGAVNFGGRHFIEIEISDNGPGMTVDQRLSIFDGGHSTKAGDRGYGLGVVSRLIESMSAMVSCRENRIDGTGTTFQLLIPFSYREQSVEGDSP